MRSAPSGAAVVELGLESGFARAGIVDPDLLAPFADRLEAALVRRAHPELEGMEPEWVTRPDRWAGTHSVLAAALSVHRTEPDDPSVPGEPYGLVAPFARRNYYRAAAMRLDSVARRLAAMAGISRRSFRICSNSRVPEKPMAAASGLAGYGASSLAVAPALGTLFVIGLLVMPFVVGPQPAQPAAPVDPCGSCSRCIEACPAGAIVERGLVDPDRCLQGWAARPDPLPEALRESWGARLYGCQACQDACPHNSGAAEGPVVTIGEIGPGVPLARMLEAGPEGARVLLRRSALDQRWIDPRALARNALLAAGNRGDRSMWRYVEPYRLADSPMLRETAEWALARLA